MIASFQLSNDFQFWQPSISATFNFDNFQFWQFSILTIFNFDNFQFWQFSILATLNFGIFKFWQSSILATFNLTTFNFCYFQAKFLNGSQGQQQQQQQQHINCMDLAINNDDEVKNVASHTSANFITLLVKRASSNFSKNHTLFMYRIWKMGRNLFSSLDIRNNLKVAYLEKFK